MFQRKSTQRYTAYIAIFAILMLTLAPSISTALATLPSSGSWLEICTAVGARTLNPVEDQAAKTPVKSMQHMEHCDYCFTHAGTFALPPVASPSLPAIAQTFFFPRLFYFAPRPLFAWTSAQPRAPPVLS